MKLRTKIISAGATVGVLAAVSVPALAASASPAKVAAAGWYTKVTVLHTSGAEGAGVSCPAGRRAVAGGAYQTDGAQYPLLASYHAGNGWEVWLDTGAADTPDMAASTRVVVEVYCS